MIKGVSTHAGHLGAYHHAAKVLVLDSESQLKAPLYSPSEYTSSVNIPWPEKGMGDADYLHAFQKIVMPIGVEFAPDLVISLLIF